MIPLSYTLRNLFRRPLQTVQPFVAYRYSLLMLASSVNDSMQKTLINSGTDEILFF